MTASCPGFASYQNQPNGQVTVNGQLQYASERNAELLLDAWEKYGGLILQTAQKYQLQPAWLIGIMMAESKGNQHACSPCSACRPELCVTGAGLRCCAFGVMQFIAPTAAAYGVTPDQLIRSPAVSIDVGGRFIRDLANKVGYDIVRIAAAYNGGIGKCGKAGTTFGWYTNADYPFEVVKYVNTFVSLQPNYSPSSGLGLAGAFFLTLGLGVAAGVYTGKVKNPWR